MGKIAIIPARGGSKRIPHKNIKDFLGKPIIAYSIEAALSSNLFDEVMVSTDDDAIAELAKDLGANVPFIRSKANADDHAPTYNVIQEVSEWYNAHKGLTFDVTCCLYATAPFVTSDTLNKAYAQMEKENKLAILPVVEYSYPIQRALCFRDDKLVMADELNLKTRSQDLVKHYHDTGQFYMYNTKDYLEKGSIFKLNPAALILSNLEVQDIDTEADWKLAEIKYKTLHA